MIFAVLFDMPIKCMHDTAYITTHNLCMCLCDLDSQFITIHEAQRSAKFIKHTVS